MGSHRYENLCAARVSSIRGTVNAYLVLSIDARNYLVDCSSLFNSLNKSVDRYPMGVVKNDISFDSFNSSSITLLYLSTPTYLVSKSIICQPLIYQRFFLASTNAFFLQ